MKSHLIAFIHSVQERVYKADYRGMVEIGEKGSGQLWCGYGYFSAENVLWWSPDGNAQELTVEAGVDALIKACGLE